VSDKQQPQKKRRWIRWLRNLVILISLLAVIALASVWALINSSLPELDGELVHEGLTAEATLERGLRGIPIAQGSTRPDLAFAIGFAHGQDRFFQMDLLRRRSAGHLSALFGILAIESDKDVLPHQLSRVADDVFADLSLKERRELEAYADGVNAGLASLGARPPEYFLLSQKPQPWLPSDTFRVVLSMSLTLQMDDGDVESERERLYSVLPTALAEFLDARGTKWDAPMIGPALRTAALPDATQLDLRTHPLWESWRNPPPENETGEVTGRAMWEPAFTYGSNNFAVSGDLTEHGGALFANDMHLGHAVPNIWYRAVLSVEGNDPEQNFRANGVTLPGIPGIVAGSNGYISWGYTNSYGDWLDLIVLEPGPEENTYMTPDGPLPIETIEQVIQVADEEPVSTSFEQTIWGPVIDTDVNGRKRVLRWTAQDPRATNFQLARLETLRSTEEALELAGFIGMPAQNLVVADRDGHIGWAITGRIPRRFGMNGDLPTSWADGSRGWNGYLDPAEAPRLLDPPSGRIWTANARVTNGPFLDVLGDGGYALGARAQQIRDDLFASDSFDETSFYEVQLDDRAVFLTRWRTLLLELLDEEALADNEDRREFRRLVNEGWTGHAAVDDVGYRLVRAFRTFTAPVVFDALTWPCKADDPEFPSINNRQYEGPLWTLVHERPIHLLDPLYEDWRSFLLARVDETTDYYLKNEDDRLADKTWGSRNTVKVHHPLANAIPVLGKFLNMPDRPGPGDRDMPRVQGIRQGASQRLVVAPGHESEGIMTMPTGQSGHFLSPHYNNLHWDWATGRQTPLDPGEPVNRWVFRPG
jgi:penicillin amidase